MKKICMILVVASIVMLDTQEVSAQGRPAWMDNLYVGGGIGGLGISNNSIYANINGLVGYKITPSLEAGMGINYQYFKDKTFDVSFNDWGLNWFAMYHVFEPAFLMARYEVFFLDQVEGSHVNYDTFLLGGGISQPMGGNAAMNFYALYNFTYKDGGNNGRYDSPWVIGMNVGIGF